MYLNIELMREISNIGSLSNIMKGYEYLSDARVAEYNKHADDLKMLKMVYKKYKTSEEYSYEAGICINICCICSFVIVCQALPHLLFLKLKSCCSVNF